VPTVLEPGAALGPYRFEHITQDEMTTLAGILRDPNPIHLDAAAVEQLGLGSRTVNQGPANMGYLLNMLMDAAPGARVASLRLRFLANMFQGDTAIAAGSVTSVDAADGATSVTCDIWLDAEPERRVLAGEATLILPPQ
jgi:acyl dehydratase